MLVAGEVPVPLRRLAVHSGLFALARGRGLAEPGREHLVEDRRGFRTVGLRCHRRELRGGLPPPLAECGSVGGEQVLAGGQFTLRWRLAPVHRKRRGHRGQCGTRRRAGIVLGDRGEQRRAGDLEIRRRPHARLVPVAQPGEVARRRPALLPHRRLGGHGGPVAVDLAPRERPAGQRSLERPRDRAGHRAVRRGHHELRRDDHGGADADDVLAAVQ